MAIHSTAFGSVTLTEEDAKTFKRQVTYGKPKPNAKVAVARGVQMAKEFRETRTLTIKVAAKAPV
jgi:hypothetical protein